MALKKLPCEYLELGIKRTEECFGDLTDKQKDNLLKAFEKCANNFEKIKWEEAAGKYKKHKI